MTDRRLTPATARVAHELLRGQVDAPVFTAGERFEVRVPLADLLASPGGAIDRQVLLGEGVTVIDRMAGFAFGQVARDGYCGWLAEGALGTPTGVSHWVATLGTHLYAAARVQAPVLGSLTMGARLRVTGQTGAFAETPHGHVPAAHLCPLGSWHSDPVEVAAMFLGVPYLWGGNSRDGLDCSGLVQAALLACGWPCPGDSDLQRAAFPAVSGTVRRGDLLFWKGHVAIAVDEATIIHANGHHMAVVVEPLAEAVTRIGPPAGCHRPDALRG
ncbi:MAG: C40 family peptidase [Paracoccaceae bacterium]|nr:MAG: C40 family peptidase [Paracoccaceae bacterium]